jgi:hypothetical protein
MVTNQAANITVERQPNSLFVDGKIEGGGMES